MTCRSLTIGAVHIDLISEPIEIKEMKEIEHQVFTNWVFELGGTGYNSAAAIEAAGFNNSLVGLCAPGFADNLQMIGKENRSLQNDNLTILECEHCDPGFVVLLHCCDHGKRVGRRVYGPKVSPLEVVEFERISEIIEASSSFDLLYLDGYFLRSRAAELGSHIEKWKTKSGAKVAIEILPHSLPQYLSPEEFLSFIGLVDFSLVKIETLERLIFRQKFAEFDLATRLENLSSKLSNISGEIFLRNDTEEGMNTAIINRSGCGPVRFEAGFGYGYSKGVDDSAFASYVFDRVSR